MGEEQGAPGRRWQAAGWKDPRFTVGLLLVVVAVLGVVSLVASLDKSQTVYVAARDLGAGEPVRAQDLKEVKVRLGDSAPIYLGTNNALPDSARALRAVRAGELVPAQAVGDWADERRPMGLVLKGATPAGVSAGGLVDVYVTRTGTADPARPELLLNGVEVVSLTPLEGGLGANQGVEVQVLVPPASVADVVGAKAQGSLDVVAGGSR